MTMKTPNFDPSKDADAEFLDAQNAELYEVLKTSLKAASSNRWHYDQIDYCWTGKDADLDTCGYQGLHLDDIDDSWVNATVHTGKTVAGTDVSLNLPEDASEEDQYRARDLYLDQAYEVVCGCGTGEWNGEWDGDCWWFDGTFPIKVATVLDPETGELDAEATVTALYNAAQEALTDWDREMTLMDDTLNVLSGWRDSGGKHVPYGQPSEGSVWDMVKWEKENAND